jgi:hypothetical protein
MIAAAAALVAAERLGRGRAAAQNIATFQITRKDVAQIDTDGERLAILLTPPASRRFAAFTTANLGRAARIEALGAVLVEAAVASPVDSGRIVSRPLDASSRKRLRAGLAPSRGAP